MASFLSKNSVTSEVLHKLIIEALILLKKAGFYASVVVMDGAQWNRGVWTLFGINEKNLSCSHPADESERLWFISDFPHLLKCLRNNMVIHSETQVRTLFIIDTVSQIYTMYIY